jgi:hypothetical protein
MEVSRKTGNDWHSNDFRYLVWMGGADRCLHFIVPRRYGLD